MKTPSVKEKNFISLVLLTSHTKEATRDSVLEMRSYLSSKFENFEILLVNNGLGEHMANFIKAKYADGPGNLIVIDLPWKHTQELAMLSGTDIAIGDFIYEIDCPEREWDLDVLMQVYGKCLEGFDIVAAVPDKAANPASRLFYILLNKVSYLNLDLITEEFRIVSRRALNSVLNSRENVRYRKALYKSSGYPCAAVLYKPIRGAFPVPEPSFLERAGLAFDVLISFSNIGAKLALIFSAVFIVMSLCIGIYAINSYIFRSTIASGWTTLSLFLSAGFSGIFLILGLLGKYLSILLVEVQHRTPYRVSAIKRISAD